MRFVHAALAPWRGTLSCYDPLLLLTEGIRNAMNPSGLVLIVTRCNMVEFQNQSARSPATPCWGVPEPEFPQDSVEDQIDDFLDGRTHGEDLLHALYDHVLDEPIPERMRSLFKK
jgi:hypothetical protein